MGFFSVLCISIGSIIGAGVFVTLPVGVALAGPAVEWGFILAAVALLLLGVPAILLTSALPAKNAPYRHLTRLVHPVVGFGQLTIIINLIILLTMLSLVFAMFVQALYLPGVPLQVLAITVILIFAAITSFGVSAAAMVQNTMVVLLLVALLMFIFGGFPAIEPGALDFGEIIAPKGVTLSALGVTVVGLTGALIGGSNPTVMADKIRDPRKSIPWAFVISTLGCMVLFMLVAYVVVALKDHPKLVGIDEPSLQDYAAIFWSSTSPQMHYFTIAGAVFAMATTINAVLLLITSGLGAVGDDQVLPDLVSRKNRFGVEIWSIWISTAIVVVLILISPELGDLVSAFGVANMLVFGLLIIPMFVIAKKFPKSFSKAIIRPGRTVMIVVAVLAAALVAWQIESVVVEQPHVVWLLLAAYAVCYAYFFVRWYFLKSKGVDLLAKMRAIPRNWAEQEGWEVEPEDEPETVTGGGLLAEGHTGASGQAQSGTNPFAIVSLVLGIMGGSVLAVIFGHLGRSQIKRTGQDGAGLALAGLVLGYIGVGVVLIIVIILAGGVLALT
jgi:amino acid transporter